MPSHQDKQRAIIGELERQANTNTVATSVISPVSDYTNDPRRCLTSVHIPADALKRTIETTLISPLSAIEPTQFYYGPASLHITIKNIRVTHYPPAYTKTDITRAREVFAHVIPAHKPYRIWFHTLVLFPFSLSLLGTTDPELDDIILDLNARLREAGISDNKHYLNDRYFFANMTLARFTAPVSDAFRAKVGELQRTLSPISYTVDSVCLLSTTASLGHRRIYGRWHLGKGKTP